MTSCYYIHVFSPLFIIFTRLPCLLLQWRYLYIPWLAIACYFPYHLQDLCIGEEIPRKILHFSGIKIEYALDVFTSSSAAQFHLGIYHLLTLLK